MVFVALGAGSVDDDVVVGVEDVLLGVVLREKNMGMKRYCK